MDCELIFDDAAPCATQCNFCRKCVFYRVNRDTQRRQERDRRRVRAPVAPPAPPPAPPPKRARTAASTEPFVRVLLAAARDPLAPPPADAAMAPPPPRAAPRPAKRPRAEPPTPAEAFEVIAIDDTPPAERPPAPRVDGTPPEVPAPAPEVTPRDEESDVRRPPKPQSLPLRLEETPPVLVQRSHTAPPSDSTRLYKDSQSPKRGLLTGYTLVFAVGSGLCKPQAEILAGKVRLAAGRLVKGAGKKASDGIVRERASQADWQRCFDAADVIICGPQARVDAPELQGARKPIATVTWLTDVFGSKRLGDRADYPPLPAVVVVAKPKAPPPKPKTSWPERMKQGLACQKAPAAEGEAPPNDKVVKKLEEFVAFYESDDNPANQFKLRITRRAVNKLKVLGRELTDDDLEESCLKKILGAKIAKGSCTGLVQKIVEIFETGDHSRLREYRKDADRCAILDLSKVWGIGLKKARKLLRDHKIWSVSELIAFAEHAPSIVEARVHRTLRCHDDLQERMSREEATEIGDRVRATAREVFAELLPRQDLAKLKVEGPMGSFRRGQKDCGDVDILITHDEAWLDDPSRQMSMSLEQSQASGASRSSYARTRTLGEEEATEGEDPDYGAQRSRASRELFLKRLKERLHAIDFLTDDLTMGNAFEKKTTTVQGEVPGAGCASYMGICKPHATHRRLDVKVYAPQHYAYAMIYFTGNDYFNRSMRCYAKACGYSLCDKGLRKAARRGVSHKDGKYIDNKVAVGRLVVCDEERDVFEVLGLQWKEPHERAVSDNASAVVEAARRLFQEKRRAGEEIDPDSDEEEEKGTRFRL